MKILTITFHRAINYGAVLQTYALQKALEAFDTNNKVIDYRCPFVESTYSPWVAVKNRFTVKSLIAALLYLPIKTIKKHKFYMFIKKHIRTEKAGEQVGWDKITSEHSAIITGSDQVWNYKCTNFDQNYFLGFKKSDSTIKASYAASFGLNEIPEQLKEAYRNLLQDFDFISVRESRGAKIANDLLGLETPVLLDPTMLLSAEKWNEIAEDPKIKGNYILLYLMLETPTILSFARLLSDLTNCKIIFISDSILKKIDAEYCRAAGPAKWVGLFRDANYIVTNSFHGTAFSIIYEKNFFVELLPQQYSLNSRFESLLDTLELQGRKIVDGGNCDIEKSIDYKRVNTILEKEREKSANYLERILNVKAYE